MPNKLFFLLFPFIVWTTLPLCFGSSCFFCLKFVPDPSHPLPPLFPPLILLKCFLSCFQGQVFVPNSIKPFLTVSLYWCVHPLKSSIYFFTICLETDLYYGSLLHIFFQIHMPCYFLMTLNIKRIPGSEDSWFSPCEIPRKIVCSFLVIVFFLVLILLAWKSCGHRVLL